MSYLKSRTFLTLMAASSAILLSSALAYAQSPPLPVTGPSIFKPGPELQIAKQPVTIGKPTTFTHDRQYFPSAWGQLGGNQEHDPVYAGMSPTQNGPGPGGPVAPAPTTPAAPSAPGPSVTLPPGLSAGAFWVAPLTGGEFMRLARGESRYPSDDGQAWGAEAAQWLGNVTGVSVVDGVVYSEESDNRIYAVDALTGLQLWHTKTVNSDMGDPIVETVGGKPIVYVAAGDVGFTMQHAQDFANHGDPPGPTVRGANFSSVYAINGLTGQILWKFDTQGEAMPTPVYQDGTLFFSTGDGHLYAVDATTGQELSAYSNPGFSSMSSSNWYRPSSGPLKGQLLIIYGTQDPNELMAVNETHPSNPVLAWSYTIPNSINTGAGDVPPVVDPKTGLVMTDSLVNDIADGGTKAKPVLNLDIFALNAVTGVLKWSHLGGNGLIAKPVAFKGSVPMVHGGNLYVGDLLNETYQSYSESTGKLRWSTSLVQSGEENEPRGGAVYYDHHLIFAEGQNIYTLNPKTGTIDNIFSAKGYFFGVWGIPSPVIVDNELYIGSISGWIFAAPAQYIMTNSGDISAQPSPPANVPLPPELASMDNPAALPTAVQQKLFPASWDAYAYSMSHNAYVAQGPAGVNWQTPLTRALPLSSPPRDEQIFGHQVADVMTALAFGVGTGVTPAGGLVYVGDERFSVDALNAMTGQPVWTFKTVNANFGQPLVTPDGVIVSSGDPWFNFASVQSFATQSPTTHLGASFQDIHDLNPLTGQDLWTFYTRGTDMMTPVYYQGNLYWVNGSGNVWGISAQSGTPLPGFVNSAGDPKLHLGGFNTIASAALATTPAGIPVMVVGTSTPGVLYGIDLQSDSILWSRTFASVGTLSAANGFGTVSPAVDPVTGDVISDVLIHAATAGEDTLVAYAVNPATGQTVWTKSLGSGTVPDGFGGAVVMIHDNVAYLGNPLTKSFWALNAATGQTQWTAPVGQRIEAPAVAAGKYIIAAGGPDLFALSQSSGAILNTVTVGGDFMDNNPAVVGQTLYIGNGYGWVTALPLSHVE